MCYYKANSEIKVTTDRAFTGMRDPITCEPIFTEDVIKVPCWIEFDQEDSSPVSKDSPQSVLMFETRVRGRFLKNAIALNQKTYDFTLTTDFGQIECVLSIIHFPKSVLGTGSYFGQYFEGILKRKD